MRFLWRSFFGWTARKPQKAGEATTERRLGEAEQNHSSCSKTRVVGVSRLTQRLVHYQATHALAFFPPCQRYWKVPLKRLKTMKTTISLSTPSQLETEALVTIVLDHSEGPKNKGAKPQLAVETTDASVKPPAADLLASGEMTGKPFETNLLHKPAGLKAKRLLLIGGGAAKKFSSYDLRRNAGAAVRTLKSRGIRSFAFIAPTSIPAEEAVSAIVEGALVGNFDPDYYRSDRKDQKIDALTILTSGDKAALEKAANEARVIGESQNFTRDLVNEPSNRMTPT